MSTDIERVTHLPADKGRSFAHLGTAITFKDEPAANGDALLLFEMRMPAGTRRTAAFRTQPGILLCARRRA